MGRLLQNARNGLGCRRVPAGMGASGVKWAAGLARSAMAASTGSVSVAGTIITTRRLPELPENLLHAIACLKPRERFIQAHTLHQPASAFMDSPLLTGFALEDDDYKAVGPDSNRASWPLAGRPGRGC